LNFGKVALTDFIGGPPIVIAYIVAAIILGAIYWLDKKDRELGRLDENACVIQTEPTKKAS